MKRRPQRNYQPKALKARKRVKYFSWLTPDKLKLPPGQGNIIRPMETITLYLILFSLYLIYENREAISQHIDHIAEEYPQLGAVLSEVVDIWCESGLWDILSAQDSLVAKILGNMEDTLQVASMFESLVSVLEAVKKIDFEDKKLSNFFLTKNINLAAFTSLGNVRSVDHWFELDGVDPQFIKDFPREFARRGVQSIFDQGQNVIQQNIEIFINWLADLAENNPQLKIVVETLEKIVDILNQSWNDFFEPNNQLAGEVLPEEKPLDEDSLKPTKQRSRSPEDENREGVQSDIESEQQNEGELSAEEKQDPVLPELKPPINTDYTLDKPIEVFPTTSTKGNDDGDRDISSAIEISSNSEIPIQIAPSRISPIPIVSSNTFEPVEDEFTLQNPVNDIEPPEIGVAETALIIPDPDPPNLSFFPPPPRLPLSPSDEVDTAPVPEIGGFDSLLRSTTGVNQDLTIDLVDSSNVDASVIDQSSIFHNEIVADSTNSDIANQPNNQLDIVLEASISGSSLENNDIMVTALDGDEVASIIVPLDTNT